MGHSHVFAILILLMAADVQAQGPDQTPRSVVAAAFAAQDAGDVAGLVALIDPEAAARFKQRQLVHDSMTAEFAQRWPGGRAPRRTLLQAVFRVQDRSEFERLPPLEVVARWFGKGANTGVFLQSPGTAPRATREILGEVAEGADLVHVVFRETPPADPASAAGFREDSYVRTITVRRTPDGWRVGLNGGLVYDEGGSWSIGYSDDDDQASPR